MINLIDDRRTHVLQSQEPTHGMHIRAACHMTFMLMFIPQYKMIVLQFITEAC